MKSFLPIFILIQVTFCNVQEPEVTEAYITTKDESETYNFEYHTKHPNSNLKYVSRAHLKQSINSNGWALLTVSSNQAMPSHIQAYWSGYLETNLTKRLTEAHWKNTFKILTDDKYSSDELIGELKTILRTNMQFMLESSIQNKDKQDWYLVYLHLWQLRGIQDAFDGSGMITKSSELNEAHLKQLAEKTFGIYLLQLSADLWTILRLLVKKHSNTALLPILKRMPGPTSALLFKINKDDILIGHVTGAPYTVMLRLIKRYEFPWTKTDKTKEIVAGHTVVFTSYPSVTFSMDDFYMTNTKLVVSETTMIISDDNLYENVLANLKQNLMAYIRSMYANRVASDGQEWVNRFKERNSGTANNEWLIFNAQTFGNGDEMKDNTLMLLSQLPNDVKSTDVTEILKEKKYFASVNIPYLKEVYDVSGLKKKEELLRDGYYTYDANTRRKLFARLQTKVTDMASMHTVMRFNKLLDKKNMKAQKKLIPPAMNAISVRRDLIDSSATFSDPNYRFYLSGGIDVKIVNMTMINNLEMMATCGPTWRDDKVFKWSDIDNYNLTDIPHNHDLHPPEFKFEPYLSEFHQWKNEK